VFAGLSVVALLGVALLVQARGDYRWGGWPPSSTRVAATGNPAATRCSRASRDRRGSWFGAGLGNGSLKWGWLPNEHNDFIFAVIAEELGVVGCLVVLALFAVLTYTGLRIARRIDDPFRTLAAAAVTAWLVGQATINIGGVVGLLPITGLPLPFISDGGSALVVTFAAVGMLASFARAETDAARALHARPPARWVRLVGRCHRCPYGGEEGPRCRVGVGPQGRRRRWCRGAAFGRLPAAVPVGISIPAGLAECLRRHDPHLRITCLGTSRGWSRRSSHRAGSTYGTSRRTSCPARST
jgi:cell division protein FtsW